MNSPQKRWPNNLGTLAGKKRMQSLVEETRVAQAKADIAELRAIREATEGLRDRLARLLSYPDVAGAVRGLCNAIDCIQSAKWTIEENEKQDA